MITDYTIIDNKPQVEIQTYEAFFNNLITQLITAEEDEERLKFWLLSGSQIIQ